MEDVAKAFPYMSWGLNIYLEIFLEADKTAENAGRGINNFAQERGRRGMCKDFDNGISILIS